jgi:hypothetical protein
MADDLEDTIRQAATDPESVAVDGASVKGVPMKDLLEADKHLAAKAATKRNHLGCCYRKFVPQD